MSFVTAILRWLSDSAKADHYAYEAGKAIRSISDFLSLGKFILNIRDVIVYDFVIFLIFVAFLSVSTFFLFQLRMIIIYRNNNKSTNNFFIRSFTLIFIFVWIVFNISLANFWINENSTKYESKYWSKQFIEAKKSIENFNFEKNVYEKMRKDEFKERYAFLKDCISNFRSDFMKSKNYKNLLEDEALEILAKGEASEKIMLEFAQAITSKEFFQDCLNLYEDKVNSYKVFNY